MTQDTFTLNHLDIFPFTLKLFTKGLQGSCGFSLPAGSTVACRFDCSTVPSWSCRMINVPVSQTDAAAHTQPVELLVPRSLAVIYKYCTSPLKVYTHPYSHILNCNSFTFSAPNTVNIFIQLVWYIRPKERG